MTFPTHFMWGAATASYQIEGAIHQDGRKDCIWDKLAKGHVPFDETGEIACDHYNHIEEDVALLKQIGLKAYRFSIAWPRIIPNGTGNINQKGLDFYLKLVKLLKEANIEPMVTLYHWDLPYDLFLQGGWKNENSPLWFESYVRVVVNALAPYVKYFITFNEPNCFIGISYEGAEHAPFLNEPSSLLPCTRNVLLAHGRAVHVIRELAPHAQIGYAPTGAIYTPTDNSKDAIDSARDLTFSSTRSAFSTDWWIDPVILGSFHQNALAKMGVTEVFTKDEWALVTSKIDFLGFNVYQSTGQEVAGSKYPSNRYCGSPVTAMDWTITPESIYYAVKFLQDRYHLPILITENGMANTDFLMLDGKVHDPQRIDFMHRYLLALEKAIDEGYDVIGYTYWSLMDNYEWACGYKYRFGLIYVDYQTQKRTLKDSANWYKEVIATNGQNL